MNARHDETVCDLSSNQIRVIRALVTGSSVSEAASQVGIHRSTIHRWMDAPPFVAELNRLKAESLEAVSSQLLNLATKAGAVHWADSIGGRNTGLLEGA